MESVSHQPEGNQGTQTVRHYFTKLKLVRSAAESLENWGKLSVEGYFVAMRMPSRAINLERLPCSESVEPLESLFSNIRWA
jgi:hypothetical protein|uniref:Uncharacterized protein n=1 Tax=uncultured bacterium A1Q1_fos_1231 TaxID=1256544 RepID=L7VUT5_9BACT|nr:hypothetical protein [uncultured bacterium A1Q1_fos_1231]